MVYTIFIYFVAYITYCMKIRGKKTVPKKKKLPSLEIKSLSETDILTKLRLFVISIFILSSLSLILVFISFPISALLALISYFMVFVLMVKLLRIKKL